MKNTVYIVHCIDTEGPLYESMEATFSRLKDIFDLDLEPGSALLRRLQAGEVDLGGLEGPVQKVLDPRLLAYNDTWDKVDAMLSDALSASFRNRIRDSEGGGWIYNWFCVDHVGYDLNPRRRDVGYHNIFDHYRRMLGQTNSQQDGVHFHFHPHPFRREAHRSATHWWESSSALHQILSRRVIDRMWFPASNRPGFHVIRPDSHWFLEQFIPFDYSNQAAGAKAEDAVQFGLSAGRFGDWRRSPVSWQPYHPSHDDYQTPGNCRRWIARCLNVGTRFRLLTEDDIRQAFLEAQQGRPVVLGITNHDFRDIRPDVDDVRVLVTKVAARFPEVSFRFSEAVEAMRCALDLPELPPCDLDLSISQAGDSAHVLRVTSRTPSFGIQPWLAIKTLTGTYHHDNFDIDEPFHQWRYVFDQETFPIRAVETIGVAANNATACTTVSVIDPATSAVKTQHWNVPRGVVARAGEAMQARSGRL